MTLENANFSNQLLIAMPDLGDARFERTITYILDHNEEGAVGLVVNKPLNLKLAALLDEVSTHAIAPLRHPDAPVMFGGPVSPNVGFVLHRQQGEWGSTREVAEGIFVTNSKDILDAIALGTGPDDYLVALGYAGWGPGQLEEEMKMNAWLTCPADQRILFDLPLEQRWQAAARSIGIDVALLSHEVGHA